MSQAELLQAIRDAEAGDCRRLRELVPDVRARVVRDGEPDPFAEAFASSLVLRWRIAIDAARRGERELLVFALLEQWPIPDAVKEDVRRISMHPRAAPKEGRPATISAAARAELLRVAVQCVNAEATEPAAKIKARRSAAVHRLAAQEQVTEQRIRALLRQAERDARKKVPGG